MRGLILNADDYGLSPGVGRGIRSAFLHGALTSTTAMTNLPDAAAEIALARAETPGLPIGVHLCLTFGTPISPPQSIPSLTDSHGSFLTRRPFLERLESIRPDDAEREWRAQIEALLRCGAIPDHLDSHHHVSYLSPALFERMLALADEYHLAIRPPVSADVPIGDVFTGLPESTIRFLDAEATKTLSRSGIRAADRLYLAFFDKTATLDTLLQMVDSLPEGITEIMCHPAVVDNQLLSCSDYAKERKRELGIISDPIVLSCLASHQISRISYGQIGK